MSKGADNIWRRRCLLCLKRGEGGTINYVWIAADQLFCANGCATKCVLCLGPLAEGDALHTCEACTTHHTRAGKLSGPQHLVRSMLSEKHITGERRLLRDFISNVEGGHGLASLEQLRIRRMSWFGIAYRDQDLLNRIKQLGLGARHGLGGRARPKRLEAAPKQKTTELGVVSGQDLETAHAPPAADLALVAAAAVQLPEEDAHGAELLQATAENVAEDALASVVAAQADRSGSAAATARAARKSRGASRLAARLIRGARDRDQGVDRVRGVAAALAQTRPGGWLGEDEASRTPDEIEEKRKRDERSAKLKENPELSKSKKDGSRNIEHEKRQAAKFAARERRKRKRERKKREGD